MQLLSRRHFVPEPIDVCVDRMACFSYIEGWYNSVKLHSSQSYRSPMAYEASLETVEAYT